MGKITEGICKTLMGIVLMIPFLVFAFLVIALLFSLIGDAVGYYPEWHRIEKNFYYDEEHYNAFWNNTDQNDNIPPTVELLVKKGEYYMIRQRVDLHSLNAIFPPVAYPKTPQGNRDTVYYWLVKSRGEAMKGPLLEEDYWDTCKQIGLSFEDADTLVFDKKWLKKR